MHNRPSAALLRPHAARRWLWTGLLLFCLLSLLPAVAWAAPAERAAAQEEGFWYTVQAGDTLYRLSRRFAVSVADLRAANRLHNPDFLRVGQRLWIPSAPPAPPVPPPSPPPPPATPPPAPTSGFWYTVQSKDTLYRIAQKHRVSVAELTRANQLANANQIAVGQRLWIPASDFPPTPTPTEGVWTGLYYKSKEITGSPARTEQTATLDFDWEAGGPADLPVDNFSAIWTGVFTFGAGNYRFLITTDDGARLYIDDKRVIDAWRDQSATGYFIDQTLTAGKHSLRVEYYESLNNASVSVWWYALP